MGSDNVDQVLADRDGILDDEHSNFCHVPA